LDVTSVSMSSIMPQLLSFVPPARQRRSLADVRAVGIDELYLSMRVIKTDFER
jgi:hypothetical protein